MSFSQPFIDRPVATSLLMVAMLLLGLLGYRLLPVSALPEVDFPTIQVRTELPGASPEVMASLVTTPLEKQLGEIAGLKSMTSNSSFGVSTITLQFELGLDIDDSAQDVQAAINAAAGTLPDDLPYPPVYNKVNPADAPILSLAVMSDTMPLDQVNDLADTLLAQKLSQVTGVGLVSIQGNQKPAVRIQANPAKLAALGLSLADLRTALQATNVNGPKGSFNGAQQSFAIGANDQILSADAYKPVIVAYQNGAPVRLSDVAEVSAGAENENLAAWSGDKPAVLLDIQRQPGANIIQTVDRIRGMLPSLTASLPPSVQVEVLSDRTDTIRASVHDVQFTMLLTIALVVMVIFVFLRKLWATVIPSIALPLSLIGTFGVMALCGFSLDNLSLMALTIATGFVVDDAIVMIENIVRYIEEGEAPMAAASKGARQIGFTVISLTVSLIAVFIPLLFMSGIVGRLFREFALVLSIAVSLSAVVSLTLTPMMCARLLKPEPPLEQQGRFYRWSEAQFERLLGVYRRSLEWVMRRQFATLMVAILTLALTIVLYGAIPKGLLPQQDIGLIIGVTEADQSVSFRAMSERQQALVDVLLRDPAVANVSSFVGAGSINATPNSGRLSVVLKNREDRDGMDEVIGRLKQAADRVRGIRLYMQPAQDLQIDSRVSRTQYQYVLQDTDEEELASWTPRLLAALQQRPELQDVTSDQEAQGEQLELTIDRSRAGRLGVSVQAIDDALYDAFGQRQVSTIFTQLNQYRVVLEVPPEFRARPDALDKLYVETSDGGLVPISSVATAERGAGPLVISHQGQLPSATLSFNLAPDRSLGDALAAIETAAQDIGMPSTVSRQFVGSAAEFQSSLASEPWLVLAAVVVIYIVLGVLYESYIHPITILSTLPSAGVGALLALMAAGHELSIVALIGIVLLIGIVKKNAIMMIDFALEAERAGASPERAIFDACLLRFRPIMMTTMAALLGALPLALESGTGSELRNPMGVAIVGGLVLSQLLTLYTTPVIYLYMDRLARRFGGQPSQAAATSA